ncbi:alpha/beta fold hydrolase [Streptomyces oryzae]|uniref:Alpha/beta fold hydrolase n=1 Tax=Streptomyces oryzae TaxID=1434886 RepID=A0ABS3XG14_9ACTN|nr:alpha/beta fold hydrolase [Streptomyces oryzae]MBO8194314.1 alpha/beta fold hydrolase [Streptomyces oryzae]
MPATPDAAPPAAGPRFRAAYDAVLDHWPRGTEHLTLTSRHGTTHVLTCGPADAPPLLLLHGGGTTAAGWVALAPRLARTRRVHAVDRTGEPGRSEPGAHPPRSVAELLEWLTGVCEGLGVPRADVCGHSYGGWLALTFALHAPDRVRRLALLDPTQCFAGFSPRYLLRALPLLTRPTAARALAFLDWETGTPGSTEHDPGTVAWRELYAAAAEFPQQKPVTGPRPKPAALRELAVPALVLLAGASRAHDVRRVEAHARQWVPQIATATVPGVSHHAMPYLRAEETGALVADFLG